MERPQQGVTKSRKEKEYGTQLREKQKVKREYGVRERQFRNMYELASKQKGVTGDNLLSMLERRLDNVVYRMGIGVTRREARQMVSHRHITVNGQPVNIASFKVSKGDVIAIKENKRNLENYKELKDSKPVLPKWLTFDGKKLEGKVLELPSSEDLDFGVQVNLIIELYSK